MIVSDGAGGAIIAWYDLRNGSHNDVYVQRISASGTPKWATNGVSLCAAAGNQNTVRICTDGAGGAIVSWSDSRGADMDVYAQRVNAFGQVQWAANGVGICTATAAQSAPEIAADAWGGAVVAWFDARNGNSDIYAQLVDEGGAVKWGTNGVAVCTESHEQQYPIICADGVGGAIIAWFDMRGAYTNIYTQRVSRLGSVQWASNGFAVCAEPRAQSYPAIVSDEASGAIISWYENRAIVGVYAQRLNLSGAAQWTAEGVLVAYGFGSFRGNAMCADGSGGAVFTWDDAMFSQYNIWTQKLRTSGVVGWISPTQPVSTAVGDQERPAIAPDGTGGAIIAWVDSRNGTDSDVYAQVVDASEGRAGWLSPDIWRVADVPGDEGGKVNVEWEAARADRFRDTAMDYYSIWRSITAAQAAAAIVEGGAKKLESLEALDRAPGSRAVRVEELGGLTYFWELIATHDALYMEGYSRTVATLWDSSAVSPGRTYFQVVAHTNDPKVFWKSDPASGWSKDNLAPGMPLGFEGERNVVPMGLNLVWEPNAESDLAGYALYRGLTEDFVPGALNLLGQIDEPEYFDGEWNWGAGYYYKLSAIDINGNESAFALFSPDNLTGDETPKAPAASYLSQNFPNPFNPTTRSSFGLAAPADVSLQDLRRGGPPRARAHRRGAPRGELCRALGRPGCARRRGLERDLFLPARRPAHSPRRAKWPCSDDGVRPAGHFEI